MKNVVLNRALTQASPSELLQKAQMSQRNRVTLYVVQKRCYAQKPKMTVTLQMYQICYSTDDTQLYVALLPANYCQDISALESCLNSLRIWFCENGMARPQPNKISRHSVWHTQKAQIFSRSEIL